jgi:hypothetical protein
MQGMPGRKAGTKTAKLGAASGAMFRGRGLAKFTQLSEHKAEHTNRRMRSIQPDLQALEMPESC